MGELVVIQTADMHGRLTGQSARTLAALKSEHRALLLDCGDALDAANYLPKLSASRAAAAMSEAGYDAMALGNREYGWRSGTLAAKLADLEQRREGDVLGASQSGARSSLRLLRLTRDEELITAAHDAAWQLVADDPDLTGHPELRAELARLDAERAAFLERG